MPAPAVADMDVQESTVEHVQRFLVYCVLAVSSSAVSSSAVPFWSGQGREGTIMEIPVWPILWRRKKDTKNGSGFSSTGFAESSRSVGSAFHVLQCQGWRPSSSQEGKRNRATMKRQRFATLFPPNRTGAAKEPRFKFGEMQTPSTVRRLHLYSVARKNHRTVKIRLLKREGEIHAETDGNGLLWTQV
ncbi:hypothetical protein BDK51DRAFT_27405 [Blyttiomyces helicus]|uniref:Uncharacterized protein n=1 Tax=Blyttiomyces helicus TaxID=388810 RepID=A0A4P9W1E8_9FUNG|nr:hypothetical protein BDK51DRAFT_27405 [Blyttiomyces helicus]|eukprot:RKO85934.1 hypothetical protein BDK51DRAFT_27405 [Blyttiomyces helicus]